MINKNKIVSFLKNLKLTTDSTVVNELHNTLAELNMQKIKAIHFVDMDMLIKMMLSDPFDVELWKESFTLIEPDDSIINGLHETVGDFSTEVSYANMIAIAPSGSGYDIPVVSSSTFRPTDGGNLGGIETVVTLRMGGFNTVEYTYKYEEKSDAAGSDPKYLHDFRMTVDSTQVLGYVVINADDTEFHNFIIDSAAG
jgi:hypothetical protein